MLPITFTDAEKALFEAFLAAPAEAQGKALALMTDAERDGFNWALCYYKLATRPDYYNAIMRAVGEAIIHQPNTPA